MSVFDSNSYAYVVNSMLSDVVMSRMHVHIERDKVTCHLPTPAAR